MSVRLLCSHLTIALIVLLVKLLCLSPVANSSTMHYVYWNTTSPIFRIDNTDHIIDVNKGNMQFEYDQVNIICPVYGDNVREDLMEKYIIYNVSKEEYDTCRITNPSPRVIAVCDKPRRVVYFTITFRSFTPQPGGLEFLPGQDYYFISTSSKDDLHRRMEGRCSTNHMKVIFKICCGPDSRPSNDEAQETISEDGSITPRGSSTAVSITTASTTAATTPKTTTAISVTTLNSTYYEVVDIHSSSTTKKTDPHPPDPGENEVVPKGEQTPGSSSSAASTSASSFIAFISLLISLVVPGFSYYELSSFIKMMCRHQMPRTHSWER